MWAFLVMSIYTAHDVRIGRLCVLLKEMYPACIDLSAVSASVPLSVKRMCVANHQCRHRVRRALKASDTL